MKRISSCRRNRLALALFAALAIPLVAMAHTTDPAAHAPAKSAHPSRSAPQSTNDQSTTTNNGQSKVVELNPVYALGSMIPQTQVEVQPARPVMDIPAVHIHESGFQTLWEFVNSLPQVGRTVTPPSWGTTAPNARQLNLRNMGSQFSLLMVNGFRVIDYPYPHDGQTNFQNLNNIPLGMIKQVQVLGSGASSLYGSDAVAGVMNIVLKDHYKGDELHLTVGGATRGGRHYGHFNWLGGRSGKGWHIIYNFEHTNRQAMFARDRPYTESEADAGYGAWNPSDRIFGYKTYDALSLVGPKGNYVVTPPPGSCEAFPNFQRRQYLSVNTSGDQVLPGIVNHGQYCTQHNLFRNWVLTPGIIANDGHVSGSYDFSSTLQAYASVGVQITDGVGNTELPFAYPMGGLPHPFYDEGSGQIISSYLRQITSAEIGSFANIHTHEKSWTMRAGLRGAFADGRFRWNLGFGSQKYIVHKLYDGLNELGMFNFFFGPQLGTKTVTLPAGNSVCPNKATTCQLPVYMVNTQRFWYPITPKQYKTFGVQGENTAWTWMDNVTFRLSGNLFHLPWDGKPVGWAMVAEGYYNGYQLAPDSRGNTTSFGDPFQNFNTGGGSRHRYAIGSQIRLPLTSKLDVNLSGRIDKYNDISIADIARTWGVGITWQVLPSLTLRGSYGTNFRAPDMQAIYETESAVPVGIYRDDLQCIKAKDFNCQATQHSTYFTQFSGGSPNLLPETGQSWTYGLVWNVPWVDGLTLTSDYWHIGVSNSIIFISKDSLLADEAGCLTGLTISGGVYTTHAPGSTYCQLAEKDVIRDAQGNITAIHVGPINEASLYVTGIDTSLAYFLPTDNWGTFNFSLHYTDNLSRYAKTLPTDPLLNTRYQNVASKVKWFARWSKGPWNASLSGVRFGSLRSNNWGGCESLPNGIRPAATDPECVTYFGTLRPLLRWNASIGYHFTQRIGVQLMVHNIFDRVGQIPYYAGGFEFIPRQQGANYTGREVFLKLNYKLD